MRLVNQKLLIKHLKKNKSNNLLEAAIEKLIEDFETNDWKTPKDLMESRKEDDNKNTIRKWLRNKNRIS